MAFWKGSKTVSLAGMLSLPLSGGLAMAGEHAAAPQREVQRRTATRQELHREEARLKREVQRLELELRVKQLELELNRVQSRLVREQLRDRGTGFEVAYPLDGHGWRVDSYGIIRDRGWRPVADWGDEDAVGLWGVDTDAWGAAR